MHINQPLVVARALQDRFHMQVNGRARGTLPHDLRISSEVELLKGLKLIVFVVLLSQLRSIEPFIHSCVSERVYESKNPAE